MYKGLLQIDNNVVTPTPEALQHPAYAKLWERAKDKSIAVKELSYVYLYNDFNSPYAGYDETIRADKLKEGISMPEDWKPDAVVEQACSLYKELNTTRSMRFVESARAGVDKLSKHLRSVDFTMLDDKGTPIYKATDITRILKESANILKSLQELEKKVKQEILESSDVMGGAEVGAFED